jgi:UDP-N-acetyl-D-mannosaminuronic acid dehydrogenase
MHTTTRVAVVGLGYVGLPTAATLAAGGLDVIGVDLNPGLLEQVNRGEAPFAEPDLSGAVGAAVAAGRLKASERVPPADAYVIAVPTPLTAAGEPDVSAVMAAAAAIADVLAGGEVVVIESTVPPGTTRAVSETIGARRPDLRLPHQPGEPDVSVAHCPERVLPGRVMAEIVANDRLVGGLTPACAERAAAIYRSFCAGELILTDAGSAEMAKLAENAFRDVNVAFANELANVCARLGLDVWEIRRLANRHPRVDILKPGPGVGGHCVAVDPWFIVAAAGEDAPLIRTAREVNDGRPARVAAEIVAACRETGAAAVACLGLAFKAGVGDTRESPAAEVTMLVATALPETPVLAADPFLAGPPPGLMDLANLEFTTAAAAVRAADVVALLVDHPAFAELTTAQLAGKRLCDTRGMWR